MLCRGRSGPAGAAATEPFVLKVFHSGFLPFHGRQGRTSVLSRTNHSVQVSFYSMNPENQGAGNKKL
jgi:hypothetical protein